jgi:hypothetical protein
MCHLAVCLSLKPVRASQLRSMHLVIGLPLPNIISFAGCAGELWKKEMIFSIHSARQHVQYAHHDRGRDASGNERTNERY